MAILDAGENEAEVGLYPLIFVRFEAAFLYLCLRVGGLYLPSFVHLHHGHSHKLKTPAI